jgi:hypothetical protein
MMCGTTPSAPGIPIMITQGSSLIEFYWNEPFDNGGTSITAYEVYILRVSDANVEVVTIINSNQYEFSTAAGLIAGEEY